MKPQIDFIKAFSRARRNAWAKLNDGNPDAKLPPQDPRHDLHARIMDRLHARVLTAIHNRQISATAKSRRWLPDCLGRDKDNRA
jgi:hypothetical protein